MFISLSAALRLGATAGLLWLLAAPVAHAQPAPKKGEAVAEPKQTKPAKPIPPEALKDPEAISAPRRESFELTVNQRDRFKQFLPKAFQKLTNREPFHMVTIGDSIVDMYLYDDAANDHLQGYSAVFGKELARQFYYTGDLRVIRPTPTKKGKDRPYLGPEITFRSLGRGGKMMLHAMQALTTYADETPADLLIVSFGINDATAGVNLADYTTSLKQVIEVAKSRGTEIILLGSTVTVEDPPEVNMAANRKYVDAVKEIADNNGIFFVDLGDLSPLVEVPAGIKEPALIFDEIVKQYRRFFNHGDKVDYVHPRPELHALLGKRIFQELIDGPVPSPWRLSNAQAVFESPEKLRVSYEVKNLTEEDLRLAALPLVAGTWRPMEAQPELVIKKGKTQVLTTTYARTPGTAPNRDGLIPTHETKVRLPIFFDGAKVTRIEQVRADLSPCVVIWKLETQYNQDRSFQLGSDLVNTTDKPLTASWEATWRGQKKSGKVALEAGERKPLGLGFDLPDESEPMRQKDRLKMVVKTEGLELDFSRSLEICRNIGLKSPVILSPDTTPEDGSSPLRADEDRPNVILKADADKEAFYLTYEIHGISMEDLPNGKPGAFGWNLNIDARSYGQRLTFGSTDSLRLTGMAADGPNPVVTPTPWAFGTGYAALYQSEQIKSQLSSSPSGVRRFTVILPRNFFYLHEWAIGNGNSQLGINTAIQFFRGPRNGAEGGYPPEQAFSLLTHSLPRDDARALAVLELTTKPTNRWTVNLY